MKKLTALVLVFFMIVSMATASLAGWTPEVAYKTIAFDINKAMATWTLDGIFTPGEYSEIIVDSTWRSAATYDESAEDAALNLPYTLGLSWDESYFYTFIQFTDPNGHDNTWESIPDNMWLSGALQMALSDANQTGDSRLEYGIGKTSDTNTLITHVWADYLKSGFVPKANEDFLVTVDGNLVTYECRTPIQAFTTQDAKEGTVLGLCFVIGWGNGNDYCHTQLASGCTGGHGKDAQAFAKITLVEYGDITGDSQVTIADALELFEFIQNQNAEEKPVFGYSYSLNFDGKGDPEVPDIDDVRYLFSYSVLPGLYPLSR